MPQLVAVQECYGCGLYTKNIESHLTTYHRISHTALMSMRASSWCRIVKLEAKDIEGKLA